jgi:hypothetical protein
MNGRRLIAITPEGLAASAAVCNFIDNKFAP